MFITKTPTSEIINYLYESPDSNRDGNLFKLSRTLLIYYPLEFKKMEYIKHYLNLKQDYLN